MPSREQLERLLVESPDDPFLNYALAFELAKEGNADEAVRRFDRTLQADPNYVAAYFHKARLLGELSQFDAAREVLERGVVVARAVGDERAVSEMTELLGSLSG